jgi:hypothetical protein
LIRILDQLFIPKAAAYFGPKAIDLAADIHGIFDDVVKSHHPARARQRAIEFEIPLCAIVAMIAVNEQDIQRRGGKQVADPLQAAGFMRVSTYQVQSLPGPRQLLVDCASLRGVSSARQVEADERRIRGRALGQYEKRSAFRGAYLEKRARPESRNALCQAQNLRLNLETPDGLT